jgi:WD40 repeat protein
VLRVPAWPDTNKKDVALTAVALSLDGRRLAAGASDGTLALFDVPTGKQRGPLRFHEAAITSLVFLADGNTLVSADMGCGAGLWDTASGALLRKLALPRLGDEKVQGWAKKEPDGWHALFDSSSFYVARQLAPALSPDGRLLIAPQQSSLGLFELASSRPRGLNYPQPHKGKIALSRDGRLLVVGPNWDESYYVDRDSALHLIDVATATPMRIVANFPRMRDFCISPDSKLLAACGPEGLRLWDTATGTHQAGFNGHRGTVTTVAFSPDGALLVSAANDGTLLVWDVAALLNRP